MCMLCALQLMNMVEHGMMRANDMLMKHEHVGAHGMRMGSFAMNVRCMLHVHSDEMRECASACVCARKHVRESLGVYVCECVYKCASVRVCAWACTRACVRV